MTRDDQVRIEWSGGIFQATVISVFTPEIHRFLRDQQNSSGGTAITVHRCACHIFDQQPKATRVLYVSTLARMRGQLVGTVLLLTEVDGEWFDPKGNRCRVFLAGEPTRTPDKSEPNQPLPEQHR